MLFLQKYLSVYVIFVILLIVVSSIVTPLALKGLFAKA